MISFYSSARRTLFRTRRSMLCLLLSFFAAMPIMHAQQPETTYLGVWEFNSPSQDAYVLILKRNGLASYFRSDNHDRTVYQGTWEKVDGDAIATLPNELSYRLSTDGNGYQLVSSGLTAKDNFKADIRTLPKETLGQWAKPPQSEDDFKSDKDEAKGYFGIWKIGESDPLYVTIESDRSAASSWDGSMSGARGLRGAWARQGSELHIVWDSGHYSILRENERGFSYKRIEPGMIIEEDTSTPIVCTRIDASAVSGEWMSAYRTERESYRSGVAFASRKSAREFYRGSWLVKLGSETYERFEISRFGGISTSRNQDLKGDWRMSGQDLFLRWDNGMRKVLSPVGEGFILYEYRPGRPLDGVPSTIYPAAPENLDKLEKHLAGRQEVARQITANAAAAGVNLKDGSYGIGRTFMRWAWPFGADEAASSDALIQEAYEGSDNYGADPWWWPLWSERSAEAEPVKAEAGSEEPTTAEPQTEEADTTSETETAPKQLPGRSKGAWYWPFQ